MRNLQNDISLLAMMFIATGLIMVYSTSAIAAQVDVGSSSFFLKKQLVWVMLAGAAMLLCLEIPYRFLADYAYYIFGGALLLLILVVIPGIGTEFNGARRWIRFGGMGFQPSDCMKLAAIILVARYAEDNVTSLRHFYLGFLPIFAAVCLAGFLILIEPDFGTCCFVLLISTILLLVGGISWKHLIPPFLAALPVIAVLAALKFRHIYGRILIYLHPEADPLGAGYQLHQSLIALGAGGLFGAGLGWSKQKLFFLTEESTDFIFAIIGEELGFMGTTMIIAMYLLFLYYGFQVVKRAPDLFSLLLSLGITLSIAIQSAFNIAVVTGSIPPKGISLPLISFGGSGLFFTMMQIGILLNIAGHCEKKSSIPVETCQ